VLGVILPLKPILCGYPVIVAANRIRPLMIQINFPICGTMAFVIHSKGMFACYLNGDFWEMVNGIKKW
jgi:hypothetical protein